LQTKPDCGYPVFFSKKLAYDLCQTFKFLLSQFIVKLDLEMTFGNVVECLQGHLLSVFDGGHLLVFSGAYSGTSI